MSGEIKSRGSGRSRLREYGILVIVAVVVAVGVRTFLLQTFYIPSRSMEQTLLVNDRVLVDKVAYRFRGPGRGEVLVFEPPAEWAVGSLESAFIKRVIGVAGDHMVCCDDRGRITINGQAIDEDYLFPGDRPSETPFDVIVPPGRVFVLGDHRGGSGDSRAHLKFHHGTVPVDRVVGRAFLTFWPPNRVRTLAPPDAFAGLSDPR